MGLATSNARRPQLLAPMVLGQWLAAGYLPRIAGEGVADSRLRRLKVLLVSLRRSPNRPPALPEVI
jgi:hypothetical protein